MSFELPQPRRAIVIGPDEAVREAIRRALRRMRIETALEAASPAQAAADACGTKADLIVLGQRLVSAADVLACRAVRDALPSSRMVAVTGYASARDWILSLIAGASACVVWQVRGFEQTSETVRRALDDENLIAAERPDVVHELVAPEGISMTPIESQVALMIARLDTDSQIAARLRIPVEDVRDCIATILARVAPANRLF